MSLYSFSYIQNTYSVPYSVPYLHSLSNTYSLPYSVPYSHSRSNSWQLHSHQPHMHSQSFSYIFSNIPVAQPSISPSVNPSVNIIPSVNPSVCPSTNLIPSVCPSTILTPSVSPSTNLIPYVSQSVSPSTNLTPSVSQSVSPSESQTTNQPSLFPTTYVPTEQTTYIPGVSTIQESMIFENMTATQWYSRNTSDLILETTIEDVLESQIQKFKVLCVMDYKSLRRNVRNLRFKRSGHSPTSAYAVRELGLPDACLDGTSLSPPVITYSFGVRNLLLGSESTLLPSVGRAFVNYTFVCPNCTNINITSVLSQSIHSGNFTAKLHVLSRMIDPKSPFIYSTVKVFIPQMNTNTTIITAMPTQSTSTSNNMGYENDTVWAVLALLAAIPVIYLMHLYRKKMMKVKDMNAAADKTPYNSVLPEYNASEPSYRKSANNA